MRLRRLVVASALVAACGGGSASPPSRSASPPRPQVASADPAPAAPPPGSSADPGAAKAAPGTAAVAAPARDEDDTSRTRAANTFALKLFGRAGAKRSDNVMVSGTSLRHALASVYVGARGETAREMAAALALPADATETVSAVVAERRALEEARGKGAELSAATRLWADEGLSLEPAYVERAEQMTSAAPEPVAFGKPEEARRTINAWVAKATQDKIPELFDKGALDARARLVVTNAIWFKGRWANPFPKGATKDGPFTLESKKAVTAPMMHLTETMRYAAVGKAKVLEMPYEGSELAMLVVLPEEPGELGELEASLSPETFERWSSELATARVSVTLPRFTFRFGGSMNATLRELGVKQALSPRADFGGVVSAKDAGRVELSEVAHRTYVAVDELGTEAAAASGGVMRTTSLVTGPIVEFKADRPFLFFVRAKRLILFAGRVSNPRGG